MRLFSHCFVQNSILDKNAMVKSNAYMNSIFDLNYTNAVGYNAATTVTHINIHVLYYHVGRKKT